MNREDIPIAVFRRDPRSFHLRANGGIGGLERRFRPRGGASAYAHEREHGEETADHSPVVSRSAYGGTSTSVPINRKRACCSGPAASLKKAPSSMCERRPPEGELG